MRVLAGLAGVMVLGALLGCGGDDPVGTGGTIHDGVLTADETWAPDGNPHVIADNLVILNGVTLTLLPGVDVKLVVGAEMNVGDPIAGNAGHLIARGTADSLVTFSAGSGGPWSHIRVQAPGTAEFVHVEFSQGGNNAIFFGASLVVQGGLLGPVNATVLVDSVTVRDSEGAGIMLDRWGGFTPASKALTVTGSGQGGFDDGVPIRTPMPSLVTVPAGVYTGNQFDEILIDPGDRVTEDQTMANLGVAYRVDGSVIPELAVAQKSGADPVPTLTVPAGVTVRFDGGTRLQVGFGSLRGLLRLEGASGNPVVLTSSAAVPAAGDWVGVDFAVDPAGAGAGNLVDWARIEYAGGASGYSGISCNNISNADPEDAAVIVNGWQPASAFVTNTVMLSSAGHGVNRGWDSAVPGPDFLPGNTFTSVALCTQTTPRDGAGACSGGAACP